MDDSMSRRQDRPQEAEAAGNAGKGAASAGHPSTARNPEPETEGGKRASEARPEGVTGASASSRSGSNDVDGANEQGRTSSTAKRYGRQPPDAGGVRTDYRRAMAAGVLAFILLFFGGGAWLASARLAGAVIAGGSVVVKGKPKSVQHLDGGILKAIHVRDGMAVKAGQLLVELDDTLLKANLAIYRNRILEALARRARLEAERDGRALVLDPPPLVEILKLEGYADYLESQRKIMEARAAARASMKSQMRERIAQLEQQIVGLEGLRKARQEQLATIRRELDGLLSLKRKGLVSSTRVLALERQRSGLIGQIAEMEAELARTRDAINEMRIAMIQVDRDFLEKVVTELHAVDLKIQDLTQQILATEKKLARTRITAPVSGRVHELQVHTIGGVVQPGQEIMQIIPVEEGLEFELNVLPQFIDRVHLGQEVRLRFPAFDQKTTPEIIGHVTLISPSSVVVPQTGQAFYRVGVKVEAEELAKLGDKTLVPGMPVEGFIQTRERTALSYFLKPLTDNFSRALKED